MAQLKGKTALVSGAGSGMGAAHVRALAEAGARVLGFDVADGIGPRLEEEYGADRVRWTTGDVTSKADWTRVIKECEEWLSMPNVLVNNAGIARSNRVDTITEKEYRQVIDINQLGPFLGMQLVLPVMKRAGGGSIINICSTAGLVGFTDNFAYVASKWALRGMTRAAALEVAGDNIRVNAICPGETDTPLLRADPTALPPSASRLGLRLGRWAKPEEIAAAVVYLASDESAYMSGSDMVIDATYTAE
jgi:3alpha(or 20beta)-hydroxysteroid dehydrogenase